MKFLKIISVITLVMIMACANESSNTATNTQAAPSNTATTSSKKNVIFFGNSLSAGYGLDPTRCFVGLIQKRVDSLGLAYSIINAGLSGETTAGGKERVSWVTSQQAVDVFVLELGGNDALRGIDPKSSEKNLQAIVDTVRSKHPKAQIVLAGMQAPPNMGNAYTTQFAKIYPAIATRNQLTLIPFVLDGVGGDAALNQTDGIHPNEAGSLIVAETIWKTLGKILQQ